MHGISRVSSVINYVGAVVTGWCKLKVRAPVDTFIKHFFSNDFYLSFVRPNRLQ